MLKENLSAQIHLYHVKVFSSMLLSPMKCKYTNSGVNLTGLEKVQFAPSQADVTNGEKLVDDSCQTKTCTLTLSRT